MKKISRRSFLTAMAAVSAAGVLAACGASSSTASSVASSVAASSEAATSSEAVPESVTIKAFNGAKELVDVEVPFDPQRIAILDLASLDILDELGVGDRVVGTASTSLDYLQSYVTNDSIVNLGNIKEADMEAVMACEPDIIFIGGRLSKSYDALCEIAPVVFLATDAEKGVVESTRENAMTIASIFGLEDHVEALMADFDSRIDALKVFAEGKTAIVGMTTSGSFNVLGNDGRCSIIGKEIGFKNIGVDANIDTSTHGNEASFEFIVDKNPDYIFAMDRDAAIGTDGAQMAQDILENELVKSTDAYKNGHVVYLAHPNVWYTAEGGIQALSRSYLAKIIPPERSGEYFGMMDTFGKGADAIGPAIIALVTNLVGDRTVTVFGTQLRGQNLGVGFLVLLFIIGFVLFAKADRLNKERRKASV